MKLAASVLHRPPTSNATTTSLQPPPRRSSGYARSLARRASAKGAAVKSPRRCRGCPALVEGGISCELGPIGYDLNAAVVETISRWHVQVREQCVSGDPGPRFPAYPGGCPFQHPPRLPKTPDWAQAARWSPRRSRARRHRQVLAANWSGRRRRRSNRNRKRCEG